MNFSDETARAANPEALVAGTFALMTTWADPHLADEQVLLRQRDLIARKIVSNLYFLKTHPGLSDELRVVLSRSHERWLALTERPGARERDDVTAGWAPTLHQSPLIH